MRKLSVVGALLIAMSLVGSASANAPKQLDAKAEPTTTGPLELVDSQCSSDTLSSGGDTVATTKTCLFLYGMEMLSELDVSRDYGVAWMQTNVQGVGGWCVTNAKNRISIEGEVRVEDQAPEDATGSRGGKTVTPSLTVGAGGLALEPGTVKQSFRLYPEKMRSDIEGDTDTTTQTLSWTGKQSKKLAFATGMAYSWDVLEGAPSRIEYGFSNFELERCEPPPQGGGPTGTDAGFQPLSF